MSENFIHNPIELNQLILKTKGWSPDPNDDPEDLYWVDPVLGKTEISVTDSPPLFSLDFGIAWRHILQPMQKTHAILTYEDWFDGEKEAQFMVVFMERGSFRIRKELCGNFERGSHAWTHSWTGFTELTFLTQSERSAIAPTMPLAICFAYLNSEEVSFHLAPEFDDELWRVVEKIRDGKY